MSGNSPSKLQQADFSDTAIATIITERIEQGYYPPGSRLPSESALATELGVSRWFTRRAYDQLTKAGVIERKDFHRPVVPFREGFVFKRPEISTNRSRNIIAALLPAHPVCAGGLALVAGISRMLMNSESDYLAEVYDNSFQTTREAMLQLERNALESIRNSNVVEGLIWWCCGDGDVVSEFRQARPDLPIVFIDRVPDGPHVDFVGINDVEGSQAAVAHLVKLGHKRIAHVMDAGDYSTISDRANGYRNALTAAGLDIDPDLIVKLDWSPQSGEHAMEQLIALPDAPTAIFAANDFIAYSLIDAAEARGIVVPRDLSVMGHGNLDQFSPRKFLTTVDQPFEAIGRQAARLLIHRLTKSPQPQSSTQHIIIETPLILRRSCSSPIRHVEKHRAVAAAASDMHLQL